MQSFITPQQVGQFVQNFILLCHQFSYSSRGLFRQEIAGPPIQNIYYLQNFVDQFMSVLPFGGIPSAFIQVPMNQRSNPDLFLDSITSDSIDNLDFPSLGLELTNKTTSMNSIAALLQISASALGIQMSPSFEQECKHALLLLLQRSLSVAGIYGGYGGAGAMDWKYFETIDALGENVPSGWNQFFAFQGLLKLVGGSNAFTGEQWGDISMNEGFRVNLRNTLSFSALDQFIASFRGANNGQISYLVMNSQLRADYLRICRADKIEPQYRQDKRSGLSCLTHDNIPILVNDYIMTYNPDAASEYVYLLRSDNPENLGGVSDDYPQTSLYAVVLDKENHGLFGIYPASYGNSPFRVESLGSSQARDTILLRGTIEAGIVAQTNTAVARMAGIYPLA